MDFKSHLLSKTGCLIVAHRGASKLAHENTLDAFAQAIRLGVDYAELDIRRTGDGFIIVHHDQDVNGVPIAVSDLQTLRSSAEALGYSIATLQDVLELCRGKVRLDIELKEQGYEQEVLRLIRSFLSDREFVVTSFSDCSLTKVKREFKRVGCGLLLGRETPKWRILTRLTELFPVRRARKAGVDFVAPHYKLLRFGFSWRLRAHQLPLWVWTVDEPELIKRLAGDPGVEALITNSAEEALAIRRELNLKKHGS